MKKIPRHQDIAFLIYKEQTEQLTSDEIRLLEDWKSEKEHHRKLYDRLVAKTDWSSDMRYYSRIDTDAAWRKYTKRYISRRRNRTLFLSIYSAIGMAACILLAFILFRNYLQRDTTTFAQHTELINPGTSKAILVLDDGKSVDLSTTENREIDVQGNTTAINTGDQISYSSNEQNDTHTKKEETYNSIVVPRAGEYKIILSDGTSVWLNSQTTLKYPVHFSGETRTVYLQGEAYFDVAKNKDKPFIVALQNDVTVRAIGTAFNIRSYDSEEKIQTILEEGKVEMKTSEGKYTMTPNMMAEYDKKNYQTSLQIVNTELYTAWQKGRYIFHNETLMSIFNRLSDWYDITILYESEDIKQKRYSGDIMRHETINSFLSAIEESGSVRFKIEDKTVRVVPKK